MVNEVFCPKATTEKVVVRMQKRRVCHLHMFVLEDETVLIMKEEEGIVVSIHPPPLSLRKSMRKG